MGWDKAGGREAPKGSRVRIGPTGREQQVRTSGWQWSDEAEKIFLDTLAASCNVSLSADAAGYSTPTVYRQRRLRPDFADKWQAALVQGYARLEATLIEAAVDSMTLVEFDANRPIPRMTVDQAIKLLWSHRNEVLGNAGGRGGRGTPGRNPRRRDVSEVRASILKKIDAIEREAPVPAPTRRARKAMRATSDE